MKKGFITVTAASLLIITGCASNLNGTTYSRNEARQVQQVEYGTVESVSPVIIEGTSGVVGAGTGAVVGGIAGSHIGGGKGQTLATVLGAVAGGVAGKQVEESVTRAQGQEITVRMSDGRVISVVQEVDKGGAMFNYGDRVRVLSGRGATRVTY